MPDRPPRPRFDPFPLIALAVVLAVLAGGYLIFPWMQRAVGYQDCIASGRITGC